jgi:hypothetical protein
LIMYGQPLNGPEAIAAKIIANARLAACSHSTGRQRADGSLPWGESNSTVPSRPTEP